MKVWIINHFAYGPRQSAGTRHYALSKELQERNHEVMIVASSFYHKGRVELRLKSGESHRRESVEGVTFQWLRTPPYRTSPVKRLWNMVVFGWGVYRAKWRSAKERPDIVVGSSPSLLAAFAAYLLACRLNVPFVLEVRDIWPDSLVDVGGLSRWNPVFLIFKILERHLYKRSHAIVTVLPNSQQHISDNGGDMAKIFWIPNGVDLEERPPLKRDDWRAPFNLMYFGAHGHYNGLEVAIEAASLLRDRGWRPESLQFIFLGDGPYKEKLIRAAEASGVSDFIDFRPAVPKNELWGSIQDADAFLMIIQPMPSLEKGISPNKLWDYLAAGRPILFSTVGGQALANESGAGIWVTPGDPHALAAGVERLHAMDQGYLRKMGSNGRAYVEMNGHLPKLAERMEHVLDRVLSEGRLEAPSNTDSSTN